MGPQAINTCYVGPALNHYLCAEYFTPEAGTYHILGQAKLHLTHMKPPTELPLDEAKCIVVKYLNEMWMHHKEETLPTHVIRELQQLIELINNNDKQSPRVENSLLLRVVTQPLTTSTNLTAFLTMNAL